MLICHVSPQSSCGESSAGLSLFIDQHPLINAVHISIFSDVILNDANFKDNVSPYSDVNSFHLRKDNPLFFVFQDPISRSLHPYYNVEL